MVPSFKRNGRILDRLRRAGFAGRAIAVAVGGVVVVGYAAAFMRGHQAVFELQGAPQAEFEALTEPPSDWSNAILADFGFITLVGLFISLLVSVSRPTRPPGARIFDPRARLRTMIGWTTVVFLAADYIETGLLHRMLRRVSKGTIDETPSWVFTLGSGAEVVKWGALSLTAILLTRLWTTGVPRSVPDPAPVRSRPKDDGAEATVSSADVGSPPRPTIDDPPKPPSVLDHFRDALLRPFSTVRPAAKQSVPDPATDDGLGVEAARLGDAPLDGPDPESAERPAIDWGRPDDRPPSDPERWNPTEGRLGIAVSGGGIRSASLALGAIQELKDQDVLEKTRYVASVSGGSYTTSALAAINQLGPDDTLPPDDGFGPNSPETQRLRRSLRYLLENRKTATSAVLRIALGILINFAVLYALLFVFLRPVGWAAGTPFAHDELRVTEPVAISVADPPPATCAATGTSCVVGAGEAAAGPNGTIRQIFPVTMSAVDLEVTLRTNTSDELTVIVAVEPQTEGRVTIEDGAASVTRQPRFALSEAIAEVTVPDGAMLTDDEVAEITPAAIVRVRPPALSVGGDAAGFGDNVSAAELATFVEVERNAGVGPIGLLERRGELDIEHRHWLPAAVLLGIAALFATYRTLVRPDNYRIVGGVGLIAGGAGLAWLFFFVTIPWLLVEIPARFVVADAGPNEDLLGSLGWYPGDPGSLPPLMAWLLLAGTAISRFMGERKKKPASTAPKKRNTTALLAKLMRRVQQIAVALALVVLVVGGALVVLAGAALNGPAGGHTLLARTVLENDLIVWLVVSVLLMALTTAGESYGWSPGPIYKRQLGVAFHQQRNGERAERRDYASGWDQFAPATPPADAVRDRLGYVDGHRHDGAELVLCTAANVRGFGNAPAGRESVSFTVSRSWTGGPELGWVDTRTFVGRLGRRRKWDVNVPGITALSGAAVSSSMGKKGLGPIGSFLALLNVRLGAWIPHPQHVNAMAPGETWNHNPGWPWYVREVVRRHKPDAEYVYVSDGGHWENFAIVEALRRGCTTIICIAAAGDGVYSLNTLGEAIEIARTDLGVEIEFDDAWNVRPKLGDPAEVLPSGRQYILNPGPSAELGQAAGVGFAFGTFTYSDKANTKGQILLLDAAMIDALPVDVHSYAENHAEFPDVSTGDQFFSDRDFESYRVLGRELVKGAFATQAGRKLMYRIRKCDRTKP